jgi:hypothetical protein
MSINPMYAAISSPAAAFDGCCWQRCHTTTCFDAFNEQNVAQYPKQQVLLLTPSLSSFLS